MRSFVLSLACLALLSSASQAQEEPPSGEQQIGPLTVTGTGGSAPSVGASWKTMLNPHTQAQWNASVEQEHQRLELVLSQDLGSRLRAELAAGENWDAGLATGQFALDLVETQYNVRLGGSGKADGSYELHLSAPLTAWWASRFSYSSDGTRAVSLESPTTALSAQLQGDLVSGILRQKLRGRPTWLELDATCKGSELQELDAGYSYKLGPFALGAKAGRTFLPETVDSVKGDLRYSW